MKKTVVEPRPPFFDSLVVAAPTQISHSFDNEAVVLELVGGTYFGIRGSGLFIWRLLQAPISVLDIRDRVLDEFDIDRDTCERDLQLFLGQLAEKDLIKVMADNAPPEP